MIGTQIGNYRVVEKLGEGGMGVVYKGIDVGLDRAVAIKVLSTELVRNPELVQRFQAEAKAQANLNHFNLATLYAFLVQEGSAVMVMEFVDGETFGQMIARRGPIPSQEAIPLFKQALLGIGTAHRCGIVHRDIKPSNLMLNRQGIVKVMDFGIAKVMGTRGMTRTGTQMGTVAYMSPEQIQNRPVDIRSDIYALGVTLYEMLSGRLPFEADSDFQIMHDHVHTPPPSPRRFYPYIPEGIENVVLKALAKHPDVRFQTVEEFGAALDHPERVPSFAASEGAPPPSVLRPTMLEGGARLPVPNAPPVAPHTMTPPPGVPYSTSAPTSPGTAGYAATSLGGSASPSGPGATVVSPSGAQAEWTGVPHKPVFWTSKIKLAVAGVGVLVVALVAWAMLRPPVPVGPKEASNGGASSASGGGLAVPETPSGETHVIPAAPDQSASTEPGASATPATQTSATAEFVAVPFNQLRVRRRIPAIYPPAAVSQGIGGAVVVDAQIDETGRVAQVRPRSGNPALYQAALAAAESWQFQPYVQNGQPVKVATEFEVPFRPVQRVQQQQPQQAAPIAEAPPPEQAQNQQPPPPAPPVQQPQVQQPSVQTPQQPYGGNFVSRAIHRHLLRGGGYSGCSGNLTITPSGALSYNCDTPDPSPLSLTGNCHQFNVELGSLKKVQIYTETYNGQQYAHLHLEQGWTKKWDLYVAGNMYQALSNAVNAARR
ncbi:MAG TPA: TonB family protein [Terriglobia bacterium]|nr:TonB family protein [Terriglobia bacterium]